MSVHQVFQTSDKQVFATREDAEKHESYLDFEKWFESVVDGEGFGDIDNYSADVVLTCISADPDKWLGALEVYAGRATRHPSIDASIGFAKVKESEIHKTLVDGMVILSSMCTHPPSDVPVTSIKHTITLLTELAGFDINKFDLNSIDDAEKVKYAIASELVSSIKRGKC